MDNDVPEAPFLVIGINYEKGFSFSRHVESTDMSLVQLALWLQHEADDKFDEILFVKNEWVVRSW